MGPELSKGALVERGSSTTPQEMLTNTAPSALRAPEAPSQDTVEVPSLQGRYTFSLATSTFIP